MPDIKVFYTPAGEPYVRRMGQTQKEVVASAFNIVGAVHHTNWQPETGEGWPVYYIAALEGPDVPPVTIEVGMNEHQQDITFYWLLAELEDALTAETLGWLDMRSEDFKGEGFYFAVNWLLRAAAGSVTHYDSRRTTGRYHPTLK